MRGVLERRLDLARELARDARAAIEARGDDPRQVAWVTLALAQAAQLQGHHDEAAALARDAAAAQARALASPSLGSFERSELEVERARSACSRA